ncbi:MAG: hypothetical protein CBARDCOR_3618 [uncultured Caballeronia sp.]|nr:MAG: hypothetical protein CBARDCOR_3618 [uncultured Caballeronia sp.]
MFDVFKAKDDVACVWMLTAIEERVNEQNLFDWRQLCNVIETTVKLLPLSKSTVH